VLVSTARSFPVPLQIVILRLAGSDFRPPKALHHAAAHPRIDPAIGAAQTKKAPTAMQWRLFLFW